MPLSAFESFSINDLVALTSLGVALYSVVRTRNAERRMKELSEFSLRLSEKSVEREWALQCCDALVEGLHLVDRPETPVTEERLLDVQIRLSSLIDQGRWLFPNTHEQQYGNAKSEAYRGFRQKVLDHLVEAYNVLKDTGAQRPSRDALEHIKRNFVTEVQTILETRERQNQLEQLAPRPQQRLATQPGPS